MHRVQDRSYSPSVAVEQNNLKVQSKAQGRRELAEEASKPHEMLPMLMQRVMDCSSEKGALNWLAVLPLDELGFSLHKGAYRDALCLHFGWQPPHMPSNCVCCKWQTVEHAPNCSHGGFPALRKTSQPDVFLKCATGMWQ